MKIAFKNALKGYFEDHSWRLIWQYFSKIYFQSDLKRNLLCNLHKKSLVKVLTSYDHYSYSALQSRTRKYRVSKGNPGNENSIPAMRTVFPVMKTGFSLWELTYREFTVSLLGFGFAVCLEFPINIKVFGFAVCFTMAKTEIIYPKNVGTKFHIRWIIGIHGNWKN